MILCSSDTLSIEDAWLSIDDSLLPKASSSLERTLQDQEKEMIELNGGDRITKEEAASTMADVEQYAALARRQSVGVRMHYSLEPVQPQRGRSNTEF